MAESKDPTEKTKQEMQRERGPKICIRHPFEYGGLAANEAPVNFIADGTCSPRTNVKVVVIVFAFDSGTGMWVPLSYPLEMAPTTGTWALGPFTKSPTGAPLDPHTDYSVYAELIDPAAPVPPLDAHTVEIRTGP